MPPLDGAYPISIRVWERRAHRAAPCAGRLKAHDWEPLELGGMAKCQETEDGPGQDTSGRCRALRS